MQHPIGFGPWSSPIESLILNRPPTAIAGTDLVVAVDSPASLDGSPSSDPDGDLLSFQWRSEAGIEVSDPSSAQTTVTGTRVGTYAVFLTVSDGEAASADTVQITVFQPNRVSVASAGPDQVVDIGAVVTLDGSGSHDPDGGALSFEWSSPSAVSLDDPLVVGPQFTASNTGTFTFVLTVTDDSLSTDTDEVTITVALPNRFPTADAGSDQSGETDATFTLDGTGSSDEDGDALTYAWSEAARNPAKGLLSNTAQEVPTFVPVLPGTYRFTLVVNDGREDSASDEVVVTVTQANRVPVADAGGDQSVETGQVVTLDGSGSSDADGDSLTYQWRQVAGLIIGIVNADMAVANFTPSSAGIYEFELSVSDGEASAARDNITITVVAPNTSPVADAGGDQSVETGQVVTLDGSGSSDADGDSLTYQWRQVAGLIIGIVNADMAVANFTPSSAGIYEFELSVSDGEASAARDNITITVVAPNTSPVADAGGDQSVETGQVVTLDGSGSSDADGDSLTYQWRQVAGLIIGIVNADMAVYPKNWTGG